jgi:hypothetical protein
MPKNEYGAPLDRNGYAPSIVQFQMDWCWQCGKRFPDYLERHEVYGAANRAKSKRLGLWVHLCPECHRTGKKAVHSSCESALKLKQAAQTAAMEEYGWNTDDFIREIGKNYLEENNVK